MSMEQPSDQRPRCDCCGEFLGPEHVNMKARIKVLESEMENQVHIATRLAEKIAHLDAVHGIGEAHLNGLSS